MHVLKKARERAQFVTIDGRYGADLGYHGIVKKGGGVWPAGLPNLRTTSMFLCRKSELRGLI